MNSGIASNYNAEELVSYFKWKDQADERDAKKYRILLSRVVIPVPGSEHWLNPNVIFCK